ncbi:hypothetical protein BH09ACT8_BH09ACT8_05420 [soil metagenome]
MGDESQQNPDNLTTPIERVEPIPSAPTAVATEPKPSRWEHLRPRSRLSQVAAAVVAAAAAVFVAVAIFATGFALGSDGGGHHGHGGSGGEHSWQADHQGGGGHGGHRDGGQPG